MDSSPPPTLSPGPSPTAKRLSTAGSQSADFVELFFDLVFVFAITQVTHLLAGHLDISTVLRSLMVFWMIWWAWTLIMWTLNNADTSRGDIRAATLLLTGVAFFMAVSTPEAFGDGVLLFAISYNVVRLLGNLLNLRVVWGSDAFRPALIFALTSLLGMTAVTIGALVPESARVWWWVGGIGADMLASYLGAQKGLRVDAARVSERHGLIVIIALGESLIVAAPPSPATSAPWRC
jgi:low temperature requirement protein LtrA